MKVTVEKSRAQQSRITGLLIPAMCLFTFVCGVFFTASSYAQSAASPDEPKAPPAELRNLEPSVSQVEVQPFAPAQESDQALILRSVEMAHATLFAILVLNATALLLFALAKFWPRRSQISSKKMFVNDRLQLDRKTAVYIVEVNEHEQMIVIGPNQQSVIDLPRSSKRSETKNPFAPTTPEKASMTQPLDDDEAVTAAVRSMLATS